VRVAQVALSGEKANKCCDFLVEVASLFFTKDLGLGGYLVENHLPASGINFHWPRHPGTTTSLADYFSI
jgi:hypothetical protein